MKAFRPLCASLLALALAASPAFSAAVPAFADGNRESVLPREEPTENEGSTDDSRTPEQTGENTQPGPKDDPEQPKPSDLDGKEQEGNDPNRTPSETSSDTVPALAAESPASSTRESAPRALDEAFSFKVPTASYFSSAAMHYREVGTDTWIAMPRSTDESDYYTFAVSALSLDDGTDYEYVVSLLSPQRTTNIGGLVYHKVVGTFSHGADGSWSHVNNNGEQGMISQTDDGGTTTVTLNRAPKYLAYKARAFSIETNVPLAHAYAAVPDVLDGTVQDMPNETSRWRKTFYVPAASYDTTQAAKTALANAGYPFIGTEPTDEAANSIHIQDFSMPYALSVSLYETAAGTYRPNGHGTTHKLEDALEPDAHSPHTVTVHSRQAATQFYLTLTQRAPSILVSGLYEGSTIQGKTPEDEALFTVTDASAGKNVEFDVGTDTVDVQLEIVGPGLFTVPLAFTVNGSDGSVVFANEEEAQRAVESISFDENRTLTVKQMPKLEPEQNGPVISARSESLFEYIQNTRSYAPGRTVKGEFRISNARDDASFKVIDYRVSPNYRPFEQLLRTDSVAIRKCFSQHFPDETYNGKAYYLYDFENLVGMSMSDALLALYKQEYPSIESLSDLPDEVLAHEIFFDDSRWTFSADRLDFSKGPFDRVGDSYVILETDPVMQALANELLYERSLLITFDDARYPLDPYLNVSEEIATAPVERTRLLYPSYRDRTQANKAMMDDVMASLPILRPSGTSGDSITFDQFAFGLNGSYISNPYVRSKYEFSFDFEVVLSVVGIEGVAFMDENRNGVRDEGEELLENVPITLHGPNGEEIARYTDAFGRYEMPDVSAGSGYTLSVETPEGLEITANVVADDVDGNKFLHSGLTEPFDVEADEAYRYNVGFVTPAPVEYYTLAYHPNKGSGEVVDPAGRYAAGSEAIVLPHDHAEGASSGFAREGHEFVSWNEQPDGSGASFAPDDRIVMDGHKTLYAQWRPVETPSPEPSDPSDPKNPADPKPTPGKDVGGSKLVAVGDARAGSALLFVGLVAGCIALILARVRRGNG